MRIEEYSVVTMPQVSSFGFYTGAQQTAGETQELGFPGVHARVAGVMVLPKAQQLWFFPRSDFSSEDGSKILRTITFTILSYCCQRARDSVRHLLECGLTHLPSLAAPGEVTLDPYSIDTECKGLYPLWSFIYTKKIKAWSRLLSFGWNVHVLGDPSCVATPRAAFVDGHPWEPEFCS